MQGFRLGAWWVEPASGVLSRPGERRHLQPRQMDFLAYLAANAGRLVTKEELLAAIWHGVAVEEVALPRCVSEIRRALGDDVRAPRYIETVPKRGYRLVAASCEAEATPGLQEPLGSDPATTVPPTVAPTPSPPSPGTTGVVVGRWRITRTTAWAVSASVLLGLAVVAFPAMLDRSRTAPTAVGEVTGAAAPRPTLAVLGFDDRSGDESLAWLEEALPGLIANELAFAEGLRVIAPDLVRPLLDELSFRVGEAEEASAFRRVQRALGADYLIAGSFRTSGGPDGQIVRIEVRVDAAGGQEPVATLVEEGPPGQATDLAVLLAARLREALGAGAPPPPAPELRATALPRGPVALRLYYEGLRRLRRFEAPAARVLLERALAEEPDRPLALLALSQTWSALGHRVRAAQLAQKALASAAAVPREERLGIEAQSLAASSRWDVAAELYRGLWERSPGNLELGIHLARAQLEAQLPIEAQATVAEVRRRAGPTHFDPRLDLLEASAAQALADHDRALAAARRAAELGAELGAELVVAHGRLTEGGVLHSLGRVQEARAAWDEAALAFAAAGDRRNEARARLRLASWSHDAGDFAGALESYREVLAAFRECRDARGETSVQLRIADLARDQGDYAEAEALAQAALGTLREIGERGLEADALTQLGILHALRGRFGQAASQLEQALVIRRQTGSPERVATALSNLGKLYLHQGSLAAAKAKMGEAAALSREANLPDLLATVLFNLGYLHAELGDLAAAEAALTESQGLFRKLESRRMVAASLHGLGQMRLQRGDLAGARDRLEAALALRRAMGEAARIAESQRALAQVLFEEGDLEGADRMAQEAAAAEQAGGEPAIAWSRRAEVLLAQGRVSAARALVEEFAAPQPGTRPAAINDFPPRTVAARVRAAAGDVTAATGELTTLVREAETLGAWRAALEAKLALAEVELRAGAEAAARERLRELEAEARARGYLLLAEEARAAMSAETSRTVAPPADR